MTTRPSISKCAGGDIYRNKLPNKCSGLAFEEAFSYRTSVNQLCNVDIIRVLDNTAAVRYRERNACGLGKFQQIEKDPAGRQRLKSNEAPAKIPAYLGWQQRP